MRTMELKASDKDINKYHIYKDAVEIAKDYYRGGSESLPPEQVLQRTYNALKELAEDAMKG
jgi:hypothetical protein